MWVVPVHRGKGCLAFVTLFRDIRTPVSYNWLVCDLGGWFSARKVTTALPFPNANEQEGPAG